MRLLDACFHLRLPIGRFIKLIRNAEEFLICMKGDAELSSLTAFRRRLFKSFKHFKGDAFKFKTFSQIFYISRGLLFFFQKSLHLFWEGVSYPSILNYSSFLFLIVICIWRWKLENVKHSEKDLYVKRWWIESFYVDTWIFVQIISAKSSNY